MIPETVLTKPIEGWYQSHPLLKRFTATEELCWCNNDLPGFEEIQHTLPLSASDIAEATQRLKRFAPYIQHVFPETSVNKGIIESELIRIPNAQRALEKITGRSLPVTLLLKRDDLLPISGSVKARGGIYEVLKHAETIALQSGLLSEKSNYSDLASKACRLLFSKHQIMVGSTGNLGLSIGIMGAQLGFRVTVHMSSDARQWKKDLLRQKGVTIVEHRDDYGAAVANGRREAKELSRCHFIDDENSTDLFLGYSVAGHRLQQQLSEEKIKVNGHHPLFVYLPCGVGGGPGGIAFGLKQVFGDNVHCYFAEPTQSACMFLGMYTGLHDNISVQDFGVENKTCADGLAVGRPSAFVGQVMTSLLDGIFTVSDENMYRYLALLKDTEDIELEPSATAGFPGIARVTSATDNCFSPQLPETAFNNGTHIVWATGGNMVPQRERAEYYHKGKKLENNL